MPNSEAVRQRLWEAFLIETDEYICSLSEDLEKLRKLQPEEEFLPIIERIYRCVHSLKGAAGCIGWKGISRMCQILEDFLSLWVKSPLTPPAEKVRKLLGIVDSLSDLMKQCPDRWEKETTAVDQAIFQAIIKAAEGLNDSEDKAEPVRNVELPPEETPPPLTEPEPVATPVEEHTPSFVKLRVEVMDQLLYQVEETLAIKLAMSRYISDLEYITKHPTDTTASPRLLKRMQAQQPQFDHLIEQLNQSLKMLMMCPLSHLLHDYPRMVRSIGESLGKDVILTLENTNLEVDRRILEALKDPLIHLLRNSVDHGLESAQERTAKGKEAVGNICMSASPGEPGMLRIEIRDDGRGLHKEKIVQNALDQGIVGQEQAKDPSSKLLLELICHSGLSTASQISEVSGRGLGMAIVREKIERLGGRISLETIQNEGTTFIIDLPVSLTTFRGLVVRVSNQQVVFPLTDVYRVLRVSTEDLETHRTPPSISIEGRVIAVHDLCSLLSIPRESPVEEQAQQLLVICKVGAREIACIVDEISHEQEVMIKPLGRALDQLQYVSSAAVLGEGAVVPVLDTIRLTARCTSTHLQPMPTETSDEQHRQLSVLVAEDSLVSRTSLCSLLEQAGYEVIEAENGEVAWEQLNEHFVDVVITDVEMPQLTGVQLTRRIRSEYERKHIPVIMCTTLDDEQSKKAGMNAGADAYFVKNKFSETSLLDTISRLTG